MADTVNEQLGIHLGAQSKEHRITANGKPFELVKRLALSNHGFGEATLVCRLPNTRIAGILSPNFWGPAQDVYDDSYHADMRVSLDLTVHEESSRSGNTAECFVNDEVLYIESFNVTVDANQPFTSIALYYYFRADREEMCPPLYLLRGILIEADVDNEGVARDK